MKYLKTIIKYWLSTRFQLPLFTNSYRDFCYCPWIVAHLVIYSFLSRRLANSQSFIHTYIREKQNQCFIHMFFFSFLIFILLFKILVNTYHECFLPQVLSLTSLSCLQNHRLLWMQAVNLSVRIFIYWWIFSMPIYVCSFWLRLDMTH